MFGFVSKKEYQRVVDERDDYRGAIDDMNRLSAIANQKANAVADELDDANVRLAKIAAMETPSANATVKRMATVARGRD